jgi:hypothetical protein
MTSVPLSLLVNAGVCVPLTPSLEIANEPLNFSEPGGALQLAGAAHDESRCPTMADGAGGVFRCRRT